MANRIVSVHAGIYGMGIYAIMLPSSGFSFAHCLPIYRLMNMPYKERQVLPSYDLLDIHSYDFLLPIRYTIYKG